MIIIGNMELIKLLDQYVSFLLYFNTFYNNIIASPNSHAIEYVWDFMYNKSSKRKPFPTTKESTKKIFEKV